MSAPLGQLVGNRPKKRKSPMSNVIVVIGAGSIGQAIARRVSAGKRVLLADRASKTPTRRQRSLTTLGSR